MSLEGFSSNLYSSAWHIPLVKRFRARKKRLVAKQPSSPGMVSDVGGTAQKDFYHDCFQQHTTLDDVLIKLFNIQIRIVYLHLFIWIYTWSYLALHMCRCVSLEDSPYLFPSAVSGFLFLDINSTHAFSPSILHHLCHCPWHCMRQTWNMLTDCKQIITLHS